MRAVLVILDEDEGRSRDIARSDDDANFVDFIIRDQFPSRDDCSRGRSDRDVFIKYFSMSRQGSHEESEVELSEGIHNTGALKQ